MTWPAAVPVSANGDRPTAHGHHLWLYCADVQPIAPGRQTDLTAVVRGTHEPLDRRAVRKTLKASAGVSPMHRLATPKSERRECLSARAAELDWRANGLDASANRD